MLKKASNATPFYYNKRAKIKKGCSLWEHPFFI
jgi:hypothetical protein